MEKHGKTISRSEAALILKTTPQTISNYVKDGILEGVIIKQRLRVSIDSVNAIRPTAINIESVKEKILKIENETIEKQNELDRKYNDLCNEIIRINRISLRGFESYMFYEIMSQFDLTDKELECLKLFCIENKNVKDIAEILGIRRETVITHLYRPIRKLRCHKKIKRVIDENRELNEKIWQMKNRILSLEQNVAYLKSNMPKQKTNEEIIVDVEEFTPLYYAKILDYDCLSVCALNFLKYAEIETIGELALLKIADVLKYRNIGKKTLNELECFLERHGLRFGMEKHEFFNINK